MKAHGIAAAGLPAMLPRCVRPREHNCLKFVSVGYTINLGERQMTFAVVRAHHKTDHRDSKTSTIRDYGSEHVFSFLLFFLVCCWSSTLERWRDLPARGVHSFFGPAPWPTRCPRRRQSRLWLWIVAQRYCPREGFLHTLGYR